MNDRVRILARARRDFEDYFAWISERSPQGAERWAASFEAALAKLEKNPFVAPVAGESEELQDEVRNIMFRTRAGRMFRALFVVVGDEVRILRIRGSGSPPVTREDVEMRPSNQDPVLSPLGAEMLAGLTSFRDALASGKPIENHFTVRTVTLDRRDDVKRNT